MTETKGGSKGILFSVVFLDLLGFGIFIPMLPFIAREFGANAVQIGWLMFVYSFVQIFMSPVWGQISDRIGRRPVLLFTIMGQSAAFFWAAFSTSYEQLLLSRILAGIFAANISTANAFMADITTPETRAKGLGILGAAFGLGFIFGPAIGGALMGVKSPFEFHGHSLFQGTLPALASGFLSLANLGWAYLGLKEPAVSFENRKANRRRLDLQVLKMAIKNRSLGTPIFTFFLTTFAFVMLEICLGIYVQDRFMKTVRDAGFLFAGMGVIMAIVQGGLIGRLVSKFGEKNLVQAMLPLAAVAFVGIVFAREYLHVIISLGILGLGYSAVNPCLSALTSKAAPTDRQGAVFGLYQSAGSLARVVGPVCAGMLYARSHSEVFLAAFVLVMFAKILFGFYVRSEASPR